MFLILTKGHYGQKLGKDKMKSSATFAFPIVVHWGFLAALTPLQVKCVKILWEVICCQDLHPLAILPLAMEN